MCAVTGLVLVPARPAVPQVGGSGQVRGMGITFPRVPLDETLKDLARMRSAGINTVTVDVWENVDSSTSTEIHPDDTEHNITRSPAELTSAIQQAKAAGMRVYFMPKLWCPSCTHTWRGILQPSPRQAFYDNYNRFLAKYADIAQRAGADVFVIGSEMNSTQTDSQWHDVASKAKAAFGGGRISYVANWDTVRVPPDPNFVIKFWDAIDEIGISAYYPLSDNARPSVSQIRQGWRSSDAPRWQGVDWVAGLQDLAAKNPGKRIVFGEVGYLSATYAGFEPYNPACCGNGYDQTGVKSEPDMAVQTNFYQALLETFETQPWWGGVVWWEWYRVGDTSPEQSMSYTPRDKMTERFLKAWYVEGFRGGEFSTTQPATTTTTSGSAPSSTTTTPQAPPPGLSPRPPPPNSAPVPMQPNPSPPATSTPTTAPQNGSPPTSAPPGWTPPPNQPPQQTPGSPGLSPQPPADWTPPPPPPNSAPQIAAPPARSTGTTTTLPPTTTTTVAAAGSTGTWPTTTTSVPPTPPLVTGTPVVARSVGARPGEPSRMRYFILGGFSVFGPMLLGLACLMVGAARDRQNTVFASAPLLAWSNGLPRTPGTSSAFEVRPEPRRPRPALARRPVPARPAPVSLAAEWRSWIANWPHQPLPRRRRGRRWPRGRR